jgi:hypothetical protein
MVPDTFTAFFAASAGVAGALIGLLFVAISVAPALADAEKRQDLDVRAGVAFSALTDALVVALIALIPGVSLGVPAIVVACSGFASCLALGIVLWRGNGVVNRGRQLRLLGAQSLVFGYQFVVGLQLRGDPHDQSAVKTLAILTVVFFVVGIARAWQLIGARDTGLLRTVGEALRERSAPTKGSAPDPPAEPPTG